MNSTCTILRAPHPARRGFHGTRNSRGYRYHDDPIRTYCICVDLGSICLTGVQRSCIIADILRSPAVGSKTSSCIPAVPCSPFHDDACTRSLVHRVHGSCPRTQVAPVLYSELRYGAVCTILYFPRANKSIQ